MGYCTVQDVQNVLAQSLTSATSATLDVPGNLINIGNQLDTNVIPESIVEQYISYVDSEIDAALSVLYKVPLKEIVDLEGTLFSPISEYNIYLVMDESYPLQIGDTIIIVEGVHEERHTIDEIIDNDIFSVSENISYEFSSGARVVRVKYPDPIILISARMAAANVYDKYFAAESSPDVSRFGQYMRDQARSDLNNILNGRTVLLGPWRVGRWGYSPYMMTAYDLPKGSEGAKDIDSLSRT